MIPFFRKIRKKMADENKPMKYMRYAIGEVVLVVIGILIALSINNWNEGRKERDKEVKYLKTLKQDLETDLVNLDTMIVDRHKKVTSSHKLLKLKHPTSLKELKAFDDLIWNVFRWTSFTPRTNTIDELISSGHLNILKNDSIKLYLLNIKQMNEEITNVREHMRREYDHYLYDRSMSIRVTLPFVNFEESYYSKSLIKDAELSENELVMLMEQTKILLNDLIMRNGIRMAAANNGLLRYQYESMVAEIEKLLRLIEGDINEE